MTVGIVFCLRRGFNARRRYDLASALTSLPTSKTAMLWRTLSGSCNFSMSFACPWALEQDSRVYGVQGLSN